MDNVESVQKKIRRLKRQLECQKMIYRWMTGHLYTEPRDLEKRKEECFQSGNAIGR